METRRLGKCKLIPITSTFSGRLISTRVAFLPGLDVYFFQDRQTIQEIWKQSSLFSTGYLRVFVFKNLFGMPSKWVKLYRPNNSGIKAGEHGNLIHDLHVEMMRALVGSGSVPLFMRFQAALTKNLRQVDRQVDEDQKGDFRQTVHQTVGLALAEAVFGPSFLQINPNFIADIFAFNNAVPWLSKGLPHILRPGPHRSRQKLLQGFKIWYKYAREHFQESMIAEDGDADPFWGSAWMRAQQRLVEALNDDDMLASVDLGVAWG